MQELEFNYQDATWTKALSPYYILCDTQVL
jgi:hypothetical protein